MGNIIRTKRISRLIGASALATLAIGAALAIGSAPQQGGGATGKQGGGKVDDFTKSVQKEVQKAGDAVKKALGEEQPPLPPGWTPEDMQACVDAGTPGPMHARLAKLAGTWNGKAKQWMAPGTEPMTSEVVEVITSIMDGRFIQSEMSGEIPGMGSLKGLGFAGFDNVSQKFVGTWLDNHSTGIMNGTGELSSSGDTMTWTYGYNCPVTKKPATIRQIERSPDANTRVFEMFCTDPKSGKEYQCMRIEFTRKSAK